MVSKQGVRSPSTGHEWLKQQGNALLASEWISSACRFVCTPHFEMAVTAALQSLHWEVLTPT